MKKLYLFSLFVFTFLQANAQDTQYWMQQFGTRSALMSGAVVASSRDNSALYYNPALLAWIDTASLSINASAYQKEGIKIKNALGQNADFKSSQIGSTPLLLGGMIKTGSEKTRLAYGVVTPTNFNFKASARIVGNFPLINDVESPGNEGGIGQTSLQTKLSELGAGIGLGRKINDFFSIGITGLFVVRSMDFSRSSLTRVYLNQPSSPLVSSTIIQNVNYYNVRFVPKIGLSYNKGRWQSGLSITVPSLNMFGSGGVAFDATATDIKLPSQTGRIDFVANDAQVKLKTTYKSPFSVAGGLAYHYQRSHIEFAAQYFAKIDMYSVVNAAPAAFARPASAYPEFSSDQYLRVLSAAKPVFNFAIAYEYQMKKNLLGYLSFRTDQSYFDSSLNEQTGIKPDISTWNIKHIVVGTTLQKGRSSISLGLNTAFGADKNREQTGNINGDSEANLFRGTTTITEANYSSFGLLLGYTYHFSKF
ncbi:hypothetical protein [Pedobacter sp. MW01-1-1]|uniref:hypothetical protein n=1 Tax=Pedobacter sp. MW01-1-1 TaxID=3383027 RepID=UPI003FEF0870